MRKLLVSVLAGTTAASVAVIRPALAASPVGPGVSSISAPILVTINGGNGFADRPRNETTIAVDPSNPAVVLGGANDYIVGDSSCGLYWSRNGGASWDDSLVPGYAFAALPTLPQPLPNAGNVGPQEHSRFDLSGDPAVAFDANSNAYYLCLAANRPEDDGSIFVSTSLKGSFSFNRAVRLDSGFTPVIFNDKPAIAVDATGSPFSGRVYAFYTKFIALSVTGIFESHSTDGGQTFTQPQLISGPLQASASGTSAGVDPSGDVFVAYENETMNPTGTGTGELDVEESKDGGVHWCAPGSAADCSGAATAGKAADLHPVSGSIQHNVGRDNSFPTLVVDGHSSSAFAGRVYIAWTDAGSGRADILFISSDNGTTWTAPKKLNDDGAKSSVDHVFPGLAVAPDGFVAADWPIDQRDDPTNGGYRPYYTESTDGGLTFSPNAPLSPKLSVPQDADFNGAFVGDYNGISADNTAVHPLWVAAGIDQSRDGTHEVLFTNTMPRGAGLVAAVPELPAVARILQAPATYGAALVVGSVLFVATLRSRRLRRHL